MSVSIDIVPLTNSLDMYGEPNNNAAFSLSGHVTISLSSLYSVFERRRAARILLQSVFLTFDGQSEVITNALGYSPLRLCSISRELVTSGPLELTNQGQEDDDEPAHWNVVFDLPIPGWLPPSHDFAPGDLGASTKYSLHAVVKFLVLEDNKSASWSLTSLYSPFRSRARSLEVCKAVELRRFVEPPTDEPRTAPSLINYLLGPSSQAEAPKNSLPIPPHILSKIQVLASVPKYVDVCESRLPFTLRLRTKDLDEADCKRLQLTKFSVDVSQEERCRRVIQPTEFRTKYPIAPQDLQPPNKDLLVPHSMSDMYQMGLYVTPAANATRMLATSSMLPEAESGVYRLTGDTHVFADDAVKDASTWYTLETIIPFVHDLGAAGAACDWEGAHKVRPSCAGPLYEVSHSLKLAVTCEYEAPDSHERACSDLVFTIPITFGRIAPPLPPRDLLPALLNMLHLPDGAFPPVSELLPHGTNSLPVYSQLFDTQGNRKFDDTPLPLYSPRGSSSPCSADADCPADPVNLPPWNEKQQHELNVTTL